MVFVGVIERSCRALVGAGREAARWRGETEFTMRLD